MKCFIGLGNPGDQYNNTKHNFGYWIIDSYLKKHNLQLKLGKGEFVYSKTGNIRNFFYTILLSYLLFHS